MRSLSEAAEKITTPSTKMFTPNPEVAKVYRELFPIYKRCHDFFEKEEPDLMKDLKRMKKKT